MRWGIEARGTKHSYATKKIYTISMYFTVVIFPKIYLGKFGNMTPYDSLRREKNFEISKNVSV